MSELPCKYPVGPGGEPMPMGMDELDDTGLKNGEKRAFVIPDMAMRPHHFGIKAFRDAFLRLQDPHELAVKRIGRHISKDVDPAYQADIYGAHSEIGLQRVLNLTEDILTQARDLSDDSFIQFDMSPDGMCKTASVGKHCTATNYAKRDSPPSNSVFDEVRHLDAIVDNLLQSNFEYGIDFFYTHKTTHTLFDFRGNNLDSSDITGPIEVDFPALIANTGALRASIRDKN